MSSFIDATCKCGKRLGWFGELKDRPKCPICGDRPSQESLEAAQKKMDDFEALLIQRNKDKKKKV